MSAQSLFNLVLKILGIYFLKDLVIALPSMLSSIFSFGLQDMSFAIVGILLSILTLAFYALIVYYLLFKTEAVIARLKLTDKVPEDPIPLNIHRSTVLSIAIIIVGLILVTQGIPMLVRGLVNWYQYSKSAREFFGAQEPFDYSILFVYLSEIVIGLLLIGNQKLLVNYVELKQRNRPAR